MSVQSSLRGLCIFKPSCVSVVAAFMRFSGLHEMHITTVGTEMLEVV